jgi:YafQ family addiction module toxin component
MKTLRLSTAFSRDLKRIERRRYNRPKARRDHPLKGIWKGWRECHVQPDWILIYKMTDAEVLLGRTGTHADLFGA